MVNDVGKTSSFAITDLTRSAFAPDSIFFSRDRTFILIGDMEVNENMVIAMGCDVARGASGSGAIKWTNGIMPYVIDSSIASETSAINTVFSTYWFVSEYSFELISK